MRTLRLLCFYFFLPCIAGAGGLPLAERIDDINAISRDLFQRLYTTHGVSPFTLRDNQHVEWQGTFEVVIPFAAEATEALFAPRNTIITLTAQDKSTDDMRRTYTLTGILPPSQNRLTYLRLHFVHRAPSYVSFGHHSDDEDDGKNDTDKTGLSASLLHRRASNRASSSYCGCTLL